MVPSGGEQRYRPRVVASCATGREESCMKLFDLTGRVALVTGGNGGIGLGMAIGLAQAGASVAVIGRSNAKGEAAVKQLQARGVESAFIAANVADERECREMIKETVFRFGRLDILINNAGTNQRKRPEDYAAAEWHQIIDTNLSSALYASQAAYPEMVKAGGG